MQFMQRQRFALILIGGLGVASFLAARPEYLTDTLLAHEGSALAFLALIALVSIMPERSHQQLLDSKPRDFAYGQFFRNSKDVFFSYRLGDDPGLNYISPSIERLTGYTAEMFIEDSRLEYQIIHAKDRPTHEGFSLFSIPRAAPFEVRLTTRDQKTVWAELQTWPLLDKRGDPCGVQGVIRDITERKRQLDKGCNTAALLSSTLECTTEGVLVTDEFGNVLHFNHRLVELWSVPSELSTFTDTMVFAYAYSQLDEEAECFVETIQELYSSGIQSRSGRLCLANGKYLEYTSESCLYYEEIARVWTFRDVSEKTIVLKALHEALDRHKLLIECSRDIVWEWDVVGNRVFFSKRWHDLVGAEQNNSGTRPGQWMERIHPNDLQKFESALHKQLRGKAGNFETDYRIRCRDGTYRWIRCFGKALGGAEGDVIWLAGSQVLLDGELAVV